MTARILIVDDSVVIRQLLREVLASDPQLEIAGVAANGRIALAMLDQISPDAVTLDVEMPELDGLETLKQLRRTHPLLPVIMFSTVTERGAQATIESLACGASDYVTKPANVGSVTAGKERIREQLIPKIKALCKLTRSRRPFHSPAPAGRSAAAQPSGNGRARSMSLPLDVRRAGRMRWPRCCRTCRASWGFRCWWSSICLRFLPAFWRSGWIRFAPCGCARRLPGKRFSRAPSGLRPGISI